MHLRCPYCQLTLPVAVFEDQTALDSLCAFCRQRGLSSVSYYNGDAKVLAMAKKVRYCGRETPKSQSALKLNKHQRKMLTSLIQSYQTSPKVLRKRVSFFEFARAILKVEDQIRPFETNGNFVQDMAQLGFEVGDLFHQNQLDYTTRQLIREKYHYRCQYCGRYGDSVDHKDPVFFSQDNDLANLTLACKECNRLKGDMSYALFTTLNAQLQPLNHDLVDFENTLQRLTTAIDTNRQKLAAQQHLSSDPKAPQLETFRKHAKTLQFVFDSVQSDYQKLIALRHDFISTHAKFNIQYPS